MRRNVARSGIMQGMRRSLPLLLGVVILLGLWVWSDREAPPSPDVDGEGGHGTRVEESDPLASGRASAALEGRGGRVVEVARPVLAPGRVRLHGRVLAPGREPVAEARVRVVAEGGTYGEATTDRLGAWQVDLGEVPVRGYRNLELRARTPAGHVGWGAVTFGPGSPRNLHAAPIVVTPPVSARIRVHREGRVVPGARVVVTVPAFGRHTVVGEGLTSLEGTLSFDALPRGGVRIFAAAEGHGRGTTFVELPLEDDGPIDVPLTLERTLDVQVLGPDDVPVSGAFVYLAGPHARGTGGVEMVLHALSPFARTDEEGRVRIRGLAHGELLRAAAWAEGHARPNPSTGEGRTPVPPDAEQVVLRVARHRVLALPIRPSPATPASGTALRVEVQPWMTPYLDARVRAVVQDGFVRLEGAAVGWCSGRVVAPSGAWARFDLPLPTARNPRPRPASVIFRRGHLVRIRVEGADGRPMAGVALRVGGAQRFGDDARRLVTDEKGEVDVEAFGSATGPVHLLPSGMARGGQEIGEIDFEATVPVQVFRVPDAQTVTLELLLADGRPGLPDAYEVSIDGVTKTPVEIAEAPDAGELQVTHRASSDASQVRVRITARGFLAFEGVHDLEARRPLRVPLQPAGALRVEVRLPEDGTVQLALEREADRAGTFVAAPDHAFGPGDAPALEGPGAITSRSFEGLAPGRYRVRDRVSGRATPPVDVRAGEVTPVVQLDLTTAAWVEGEVRAPEGTDLAAAWIEIASDGRRETSLVRVDATGRFRARVQGDTTQTLTVRHPLLAPATRGGRLEVRGGAGSVVLRLEPGAEVRFSIPEDVPTGVVPRVLLAAAGAERPEAVRPVLGEDGRWRFGGFPHGSYRAWIDLHRGIPVLRRFQTQAGDALRDLGLVRVQPGGRVIVRTPGGSGLEREGLSVAVHLQGIPAYRRAHFRPPGSSREVEVRGLRPGRARVRVERMRGAPAKRLILERDVEIPEGGASVEIVLGDE